MAYLDIAGLQYFWEKIKTKFAEVVHTHDDRYYTEDEMNVKLLKKSDIDHTHDDRYLKLSGGIISGNLQVDGTTTLKSNVMIDNDCVTTGKISRAGGGSWIKDRDHVVAFGSSYGQQAGYSYNPVAGQKTTNGAWTIGNLAGNENLVFNYTKDSNYTDNTNSSARVFLSAGSDNDDVIIVTSATFNQYTANNSNKLGGFPVSTGWETVGGNIKDKIPLIQNDGGMEVGWYLDFHRSGSTQDYDGRICIGNDNHFGVYMAGGDKGTIYTNVDGSASQWNGCIIRNNHNTNDTWIPVWSNNYLDYVLKSEIADTTVTYSSSGAVRIGKFQICFGSRSAGSGATVTYELAFTTVLGAYVSPTSYVGWHGPYVDSIGTTSMYIGKADESPYVNWMVLGYWK